MLRNVKPETVYHLAGQSHVKISFDMPEYTADSTGLGTLRLLESMRHVVPDARLFLAATSEIFGEAKVSPQSEQTPMNPINPVCGGEGLRAQPRAGSTGARTGSSRARGSSSTTRARAAARTT